MNVFAFAGSKRRALSLVGAAALSLSMVVPALASDDTNLTVTGGTLTMTPSAPTVGNFAGVTLNGTIQDTTATLQDLTVNDATGSGSGWHLTASATQFKEWDTDLNSGAGGYVEGGHDLDAGSLAMPVLEAAEVVPTDSTAPAMLSSASAFDGVGAITLANAITDRGMGEYLVDDDGANDGITLTLTVEPDTYAATGTHKYRSDVTITLSSGPA
jgi:hypothetical protein